jgi:hypothetical protein
MVGSWILPQTLHRPIIRVIVPTYVCNLYVYSSSKQLGNHIAFARVSVDTYVCRVNVTYIRHFSQFWAKDWRLS